MQTRTTYEYDHYSSDSLHAPLAPRAGISGFDAVFTPSYLTRGNVTLTTSYADAAGGAGAVSAAVQYDVAGNAVKTIDARGNALTFDFTDRYGTPNGEARANTAPAELSAPGQSSFAFITSVTNALGHTSYGQYDYQVGAAVDGEDVNGVVTSGYYDDPLDRAKKVVRAVGTPVQSQTTFTYDLSARSVTTTSDLNSYDDNLLKSQTLYDGLGRTVETRQYESSVNYTAVRQVFDELGRVSQTSSPYRPWQGESPVWTTSDYDALGRAWRVTTPDGAKVITHFDGARTLVTDQMNRQRLSKVDALGRPTDVWEIRTADAATEGVTFPSFSDVPNVSAGYRTSYTYDALGNARKIEQGVQSRYFMHDSLGRLLRAKNPEQAVNGVLTTTDPLTGNSQWSLGYTYDAGGNLLTKTDARNVTITYVYDALNRSTTIDYSDTAASPDVTRAYDSAVNGKGRPRFTYAGGNYSQGSTVEHTASDEYDALGRPVVVRQYFKTGGVWGSAFEVRRAYDLAGGITSQTYPSGRTVGYQYDAAGRLNDFRGNLGDGVLRVYSTGIQYTPAGALRQEQFGTDTPVYNKLTYNTRLQLSEIRVGTTSGDTFWNRGAIINHYSDQSWAGSGTDNNGALKKQDVYIPNDDAITGHSLTTQFYTYDALNRLQTTREVRGGTTLWQQDYTLDRWGNRTVNSSSWGGVPEPQYGADTATNRMTAPAGYTMTYDAAGRLTYDNYNGGAGGGPRTYDAEGRMTEAQFVYGQTQTAAYSYNADGLRTRRKVGAGGEVWHVYGAGGELLAEYAAGAAPASPLREYGYRGGGLLVTAEAGAQITWLVADQLGTPRMALDKSGALSGVRRHDYLPYGEELYAGAGGRTPQQGYAPDNIRQQFTAYERDGETKLDFAQARYFSSSQGRFTSPDPLGASMRSGDPQSLNRYSYTGNDPVNRTDSTGLDWTTDASNWGGGSINYQNNIGELDRVLAGRAGSDGEFDWSPIDPIPLTPPADKKTEVVTVTVLDAADEVAEPENSSEDCGCTLQVRGRAGAPLSRGNPLRFPGRRQTLGPAYINDVDIFGWQVEITGTTSDDISTWFMYQTWEGASILESATEPKSLRLPDTGREAITGYTPYVHQPKGGRRFYFIDGPGLSGAYFDHNKDAVSLRTVTNYTSYMTKGSMVRKVEWSVTSTVVRGKMTEANFYPHHMPLP